MAMPKSIRRITITAAAALACMLSGPMAQGAQYRIISSPSGNIVCDMHSSYGVRCDVRMHTWSQPANAGCDLDWGDSLYVGRTGRAQWTCHGDTLLGSPSKTLAYGRSVQVGRYVCTSKTTGMRCVNSRNGHGFLISKSKHVRF